MIFYCKRMASEIHVGARSREQQRRHVCTRMCDVMMCNLTRTHPSWQERQFNLPTLNLLHQTGEKSVWDPAVIESSIVWDQTDESQEDETEKTRHVRSCIIYGHLNKSTWKNELEAAMKAKWGFSPYCASGSAEDNATFKCTVMKAWK